VAVASAGPYASLHHAPDRQQRQHPTTEVFYRPDALPAAQPTASKHLHRNSEITLWDTDSHLLFQTWSKSVQDKYLKGCICIGDKKTRFGGVWQNPWGNFPKFFVRARTVVPHLYSRFHPICSGLGEL